MDVCVKKQVIEHYTIYFIDVILDILASWLFDA